MIFVTVGNDFRSFDRLLRKVDEIAPLIPEEMIVQRGYSTYLLRNTKQFDFVSMEETVDYIRKSRLVVSHAGIGTVILCRKYGIPLLILPRRKIYGEHMNDHQMEIAKALENRERDNLHVIYEEDQLEEKILAVLKRGKNPALQEDAGRTNLVRTIKGFIKAVEP